MKFTNMYGVQSQSIIDALVNDDYDLSSKPGNVFSCTECIDAPKAKVLYRRHEEEITVDISDNFHTMDGSAVHYVIEKSNKKSMAARLFEERIYIDVTTWEAHTLNEKEKLINAPWYDLTHIYVSFKADNYEEAEECVEDYKRTSVYEAKSGLKDTRVKQLNINGLGFCLLGFPVKKLRACLLLKDWSGAQLKSEESTAATKGWECKYPPIPYKEFLAPMWTYEECKAYILERVSLHLEARKLSDEISLSVHRTRDGIPGKHLPS